MEPRLTEPQRALLTDASRAHPDPVTLDQRQARTARVLVRAGMLEWVPGFGPGQGRTLRVVLPWMECQACGAPTPRDELERDVRGRRVCPSCDQRDVTWLPPERAPIANLAPVAESAPRTNADSRGVSPQLELGPVANPCACGCGRPVASAGRGRPRRYATPACRRDEDASRKREARARRAAILAAVRGLADAELLLGPHDLAAVLVRALGEPPAPRGSGRGTYAGSGPQKRRVLRQISE